MAQADYIISNQTFPNTRADINNHLSAIATNNSGTSAPTTQYAGQFWIDTTSSTWTLYIHDGTDDIQFATIDTSANTVNFIDSALDVVTDTTPQLGGDLDLNSNDITGTGNINITGTATVSGDLTVDTNTLYVNSANNRVGIGTSSPSTKLMIGAAADDGIFVKDSNSASASPTVKVQGQRSDSNGSQCFAGGIVLQRYNSGGLIGSADTLGNIYFGGNHTDSSESNISYAASITGISDGDFNSVSDMPTAITFKTGSTGTALSTSNVSYGTERMRITSSGNVGIGTSSPQYRIESVGTNAGGETIGLTVRNNATTTGGSASIYFVNSTDPTSAANRNKISSIRGASGHDLAFYTNDGTLTERMRLNSAGNVGIGKTPDDAFGVAGCEFNPAGYLVFNRNGDMAYFNRTSSDGVLINFLKAGTTSGKIGVLGTELYIGSDSGSGSYFNFGSNRIIPASSSGGNRDNIIDLGNSGSRFDDIYATNGTIQTSDQNEKQSIQSLTASEMAVAQRISKLFKTFKWNSAVEEKGDSARTHTGIIAQDVQQAFLDEGLDAGNYALFISSTWWEKEISVDAVAEELDEEGNVIVEGKDAYTYIDTKEEATEGYTERTRLGIRYPELLSFVSSAFEQRLTNIETRLTALET